MFLSRQSQKRCPPSNAAWQDGTRSWEKYGKHQKLWAKKAREGWDASESACKEPASREAERNRAIRSMRHHAGAAVSCQNRQKWWQCDIKKCLLQIHSLLRLGHFKSIWNLWIQFFWSLDSWWYKQQEMLQRLDFRNRQTSKWRMTREIDREFCNPEWPKSFDVMTYDHCLMHFAGVAWYLLRSVAFVDTPEPWLSLSTVR